MAEPDLFAALSEMKRLLPSFSDWQFASFAALCAERHRPLFDAYFGGADDRALRDSIVSTLWRAALGQDIDANGVSDLRDRAERIIEELYESDDTDYPLQCWNVLSMGLSRLASREWDADANLAVAAQDVAQSSGVRDPDAAIEEEGRWQVAVARNIAGIRVPTREQLFGLLTDAEWIREFEGLA